MIEMVGADFKSTLCNWRRGSCKSLSPLSFHIEDLGVNEYLNLVRELSQKMRQLSHKMRRLVPNTHRVYPGDLDNPRAKIRIIQNSGFSKIASKTLRNKWIGDDTLDFLLPRKRRNVLHPI